MGATGGREEDRVKHTLGSHLSQLIGDIKHNLRGSKVMKHLLTLNFVYTAFFTAVMSNADLANPSSWSYTIFKAE